MNDLLCLVTELKEVERLIMGIRESKRERDWWNCTLPTMREALKKSEESWLSYHQAGGHLGDGGKGNESLVRGFKELTPDPQIPLQNRYEFLV